MVEWTNPEIFLKNILKSGKHANYLSSSQQKKDEERVKRELEAVPRDSHLAVKAKLI